MRFLWIIALLGVSLAPAAVRAADVDALEQKAIAAAVEAAAKSVVQIQTIGGVDQLQSSSGQRLGHLGDHAKHPVGFTRT